MADSPRDIEAELAAKEREARILRQVSAELNATLNLEEIPDIVLRTMDELFGFRHSMILLLDDGGDTLSVVASRGYPDSGQGATVKVGTGVVGVVAKKRRTMRATGLGQTYSVAHSNCGVAKHELGDYEGALAELDRALELDPQNEWARGKFRQPKSIMLPLLKWTRKAGASCVLWPMSNSGWKSLKRRTS